MRKRVMSTTNAFAALALTAIVADLCATQGVGAQDGVMIDVRDCIALASPDERLACYERHVEAAGAQKAAAPIAPAASASSAAPDTALITTPRAGAAQPAPLPAAAPPPAAAPAAVAAATEPARELTATIAAVSGTTPNTYLITLDNGQVWRQSYAEPFTLRPGMRVTLRPSKWGSSYRLSAEGINGFIQVKRVK